MGVWLSGRAPALHAGGPGFDPLPVQMMVQTTLFALGGVFHHLFADGPQSSVASVTQRLNGHFFGWARGTWGAGVCAKRVASGSRGPAINVIYLRERRATACQTLDGGDDDFTATMRMRRAFAWPVPIALFLLARVAHASLGDRLPEFKECLKACTNNPSS